MSVDEEFMQWKKTRDIDFLFSATRDAITIAKMKIRQATINLGNANSLYWDMKNNPSEKDKYNKELDELLLPLESFITDHVGFEGESYDDEAFKIPDFIDKKGKKQN